MSQYQKIFIIADTALRRTPAIERARRLAQATGARIKLALFDHHAGIAAVGVVSEEVMALAKASFMREREEWLDEEARLLREDGLEVDTEAYWDTPIHETVVAAVAAFKPDLVVKDVHAEPALKRLLYTPLDWQLMRLCPAPLLLVNPQANPLPKRVIASVDTGVTGNDAEALNDTVVRTALQLSLQCNATLHLAHAFDGLSTAAMVDPQGDGLLISEAYDALRAMRQERFDAFAGKHGVPNECKHFLEGPTADAISEFASTTEADVVAVGTVFREGLERLVLGSTAERVLQHIHCDVLVVKPPKFIHILAEHLDIPEDLLPPFPA